MAGFGRSNSLSINTGGGAGGASSGSSLFGNTNTASTAQTGQPQSSGGLFGGAAQSKPSLFASSTQQPTGTTAAAATPSLFTNMAAQQQPQQQAAPSLFGSTLQPQPQAQQNSLFGAVNSQTGTAPLGNSTLGTSVQPVQMTLDSIRGTTRFNDLHPELQSLMQQFDDGIQRKIGYCSQIRETLPRNEADIATIAPDVAYIDTFLSTIETGLDNDSTSIAHLKELVKKDAADATLSFRAIENQRLPAQFHYRNSANLTASTANAPVANPSNDEDPTKPVDLMSYFGRRTDELGRTLDVYQRQIREIEAHLRTMEAGTVEKAQQLTGSRSAPRDQRRELVEALKAIEGAILDSAKKVGQVRDQVTKETLGTVGTTLL